MTTVWFSKLDSCERDPQEPPFQPKSKKTHIPLFGKPREIGYFSIDANRRIHFNKSQMKYLISSLKTRDLYLDLNVNFHTDICHKYVTIEKMHQMLYWLLNNKEIIQKNKLNCPKQKSNIDFVTVRGALTLVTCTPYLKGFYRDQWEICACKFQGIIYFATIDSDIDVMENENMTPKHALFQAWGYKFEQYMTTDHIDGVPDLSSNTHQLEEFCIVLKNVLNGHSLLYKAEIDAVVPHRYPGPGSGDTSCYTELKTAKIIRTENEKFKFQRYKMVTWWAQSYMAGVPEVICGLRDDNGIVQSIKIHYVSDMAHAALGLWSPDACLHFCDKFLNFLKKTVIEDDHRIVYHFRYTGDDISCRKLVNPEQRYRIIPDWFADNMKE